MTNIYEDGTYYAHNPNWHQEESPWKVERIVEVIQRNDLKITSVGDLGCGAGEVLKLLSERLPYDISYAGYDISPQAHALSASKATAKLQFHLKDLLQEQTSFDLVLALDVIEHVEDYMGFLRKLRSKARYKLFHIPLDLCAQRVLRVSTMLDDIETVGHLHFFTRETALAALKRAGYRIIDEDYIAKRIDLRMGGKAARLLTAPRKALSFISKDMAARTFGGWSLSVLAE